MICKPFLLFAVQVLVGLGALQILVVKLLVVVFVLILDPVESVVKFFKKIRPALRNNEIERRRTDLPDRNELLIRSVDVHRYEGVVVLSKGREGHKGSVKGHEKGL